MTNNGNGGAASAGKRAAIKGFIMLAVLGGVVFATRQLGVVDLLKDTEWFTTHVIGKGPLSYVIFLCVAAGLTGVGLPRQLVAFLGGMTFGVLVGTTLSTIGASAGCLIASFYARYMGRDFVARKFGRRAKRVDAFISRQPFLMGLTIRLFPLGNNLMTNLAVGISSVPLLPFILGSGLGYIPQHVVFAAFGKGMKLQNMSHQALTVGTSAVMLVLSAWLGVVMYRRHKRDAAGIVGEED